MKRKQIREKIENAVYSIAEALADENHISIASAIEMVSNEARGALNVTLSKRGVLKEMKLNRIRRRLREEVYGKTEK